MKCQYPASEANFLAKKEKLQLAFYQEKKKVAGFTIQGGNTRFRRVAVASTGKQSSYSAQSHSTQSSNIT